MKNSLRAKKFSSGKPALQSDISVFCALRLILFSLFLSHLALISSKINIVIARVKAFISSVKSESTGFSLLTFCLNMI
jgi:hypothetical protein